MTQIIRCRVENILGAKLIDFAPNGQSVTLGGANGQGKSSAIRALCMALGGREQLPAEPVSAGAEKGSVVVELDEFTVTLEVDKNRKSELVIESKNGARFQRPQSMLDRLFGGLSFNPGAFKSLDKKARLETLRKLVGLDFADLDSEYESLYEQRRDVGRKVSELAARESGRRLHQNIPEEEVSVADLMAKLRIIQAKNRSIEDKKRTVADYAQQVSSIARSSTLLMEQNEELKRTIARNEAKLEAIQMERKRLVAEQDKLIAEVDAALIADNTMDEALSLDKQISEAESINRKVRENADLIALRGELNTRAAEHESLELHLKCITETKSEMLESAKFPVEGLSFNGDGVTYRGIPFEQVSESEQWEISTAIGFALNPKGILFMANSGGLDKTSRQRIRDRAEALGVQLFLEVVDDADDVTVLVEEGLIKEDRLKK